MKFCIVCNNMYYIRINEDNQNSLVYYCRNCKHEDTTFTEDNICVNKINLKGATQELQYNINKYTKYDPTLPRVNNILCPNPDCQTNKKADTVEREIIYIRYNDVNMNYIYLCPTCDTVWKP